MRGGVADQHDSQSHMCVAANLEDQRCRTSNPWPGLTGNPQVPSCIAPAWLKAGLGKVGGGGARCDLGEGKEVQAGRHETLREARGAQGMTHGCSGVIRGEQYAYPDQGLNSNLTGAWQQPLCLSTPFNTSQHLSTQTGRNQPHTHSVPDLVQCLETNTAI